MNCFMFPGQPMAMADLPADDPAFLEMSQRCQSVSGFSPLDSEKSSKTLSDSVRLQMYGTTMSLYHLDLALRRQGLPDLIAEHSMGIYSALAACGSIDSMTALELTFRIGGCLSVMGGRRRYALGSVIGLAESPLDSIAGNNCVHIANYNTSRHFLLAGEWDGIRAATSEAEAAGAFSVGVFPCDAPLHTPLVEEVAAELHAIVSEYTFREPFVPLMDHLLQRRLKRADIPRFLVEELCRPVFWEKTCRALQWKGLIHFTRWVPVWRSQNSTDGLTANYEIS